MQSVERLHALDAVRAYALLLGVVLHSATVFLENFPVPTWRDEPSATAAVIMSGLWGPVLIALPIAAYVWQVESWPEWRGRPVSVRRPPRDALPRRCVVLDLSNAGVVDLNDTRVARDERGDRAVR